MQLSRRSFLKGLLYSAAAASAPVSFEVLALDKPVSLVMTPFRLQKVYKILYMAEIWSIDTRFGEIKGDKAVMDNHIYYSVMVDDSDKAVTEYYEENIIDKAVASFDKLLKDKYGSYKVVTSRDVTRSVPTVTQAAYIKKKP